MLTAPCSGRHLCYLTASQHGHTAKRCADSGSKLALWVTFRPLRSTSHTCEPMGFINLPLSPGCFHLGEILSWHESTKLHRHQKERGGNKLVDNWTTESSWRLPKDFSKNRPDSVISSLPALLRHQHRGRGQENDFITSRLLSLHSSNLHLSSSPSWRKQRHKHNLAQPT